MVFLTRVWSNSLRSTVFFAKRQLNAFDEIMQPSKKIKTISELEKKAKDF